MQTNTTVDTRSALHPDTQQTSTREEHATDEHSHTHDIFVPPTDLAAKHVFASKSQVPLHIIHSSASIVSTPSPRLTFRGMSFDEGLSSWESYAETLSDEHSRAEIEDELKRMRSERRSVKSATTSVRSAGSSVRKAPSRYRRDKDTLDGESVRSDGKSEGISRQPTVSSNNTETMESSFRDFDGVHAEIQSIYEEPEHVEEHFHELDGLESEREGKEKELADLQHDTRQKQAPQTIFDEGRKTTPSTDEVPRPRSQSPFPKMGEPVPGMIYYPAPVPRLLNLPRPLAVETAPKDSNEYMIPRDLDLVNGSATLTLDCILDAAAFSPSDGPSNPMENSRGREAFRRSALEKARGRRNKRSDSFTDVDLHGNNHETLSSSGSSRSRSSSLDSISRILHTSHAPNHDSFLADLSAQAPTTLLAELMARKTQQKNRMKTAQTAFPNGAHTTLLQLDAVAEYQMDIRKGKAPLPYEDEVESEDDVPLGVLYPDVDTKSLQVDAEDDELLSSRKTRLQRENDRPVLLDLDLGSQDAKDGNDEVEDEHQPLSRRKKDLLAKSRPDDFASTLLSSLSGLTVQKPVEKAKDDKDSVSLSMKSATDSGQSESIAQRKRRLQAERLARAARPVLPQVSNHVQSQYGLQSLLGNSVFTATGYATAPDGRLMSMGGASNPLSYAATNAQMFMPMHMPIDGNMYGGQGMAPSFALPQGYNGTMPVNMVMPIQMPFNQQYSMGMHQQFAHPLQRPVLLEQPSASRQTWSSHR